MGCLLYCQIRSPSNRLTEVVRDLVKLALGAYGIRVAPLVTASSPALRRQKRSQNMSSTLDAARLLYQKLYGSAVASWYIAINVFLS